MKERDMKDYFGNNNIDCIDIHDWGIDELTAFRWGLAQWLMEQFPYFNWKDADAISGAAAKEIVNRFL